MKISISGILAVILMTLSTVSLPAQSRMDRLREDYDSLGNITGKYLFPKEKGMIPPYPDFLYPWISLVIFSSVMRLVLSVG